MGTEVLDGVAFALALAAVTQLFRHRTVRPEGGLYGRIECGGAFNPTASAADWCRSANTWAWQSALLLFAVALTIWALGRWSKVEAVRRALPNMAPRLMRGTDRDVESLAPPERSEDELVPAMGVGGGGPDPDPADASARRPRPPTRRRRSGSTSGGLRRSRGGLRVARRGSGASPLRSGRTIPTDRALPAPADLHPAGPDRKPHPPRGARFHPREVRRGRPVAPPDRRSSSARRRPPRT